MEHIIEVSNISFCYPHTKKNTLTDCSLTINRGELLSILGPNGAGKSTLLNCSCGLLTPQKGTIYINGTDVRRLDQKKIARTVGYVQQQQYSAFSHTVFDYVLMGRACNVDLFHQPDEKDREIARETIEMMGLSHISDSAITEISGGERQQAAIARAVAQRPQVLFFDEPTAHLDYGNQVNTLRMIKRLQREGFAIVMTTHNPDHCMMLGERVAILDREGHLEDGPVTDMLTEAKLHSVYNANMHIVYIDRIGRTACVPESL